MPLYAPSYLDRLNAFPENFARFVTRIPEVPVSSNREETLAALLPAHERFLRDSGIDPKYLRRAQQVHGNKVAIVGDIGCSYPERGGWSVLRRSRGLLPGHLCGRLRSRVGI